MATAGHQHRMLFLTLNQQCENTECTQKLLLLLHLFNGLFSRTTRVSRHQKGKPFWILLEQEMMRWHVHQLDHMQIICTSLQTDNHATPVPHHSVLQAGCPLCCQTNSVKALNAPVKSLHVSQATHLHSTILDVAF